MNKTCAPLEKEQYENLINAIRNGFAGLRPNNRVAIALMLQANIGLRIGDVLNLRMSSFKKNNDRYYLDICEDKTGKSRKQFIIPHQIVELLKDYAIANKIGQDELLFDMTERAVQKTLAKAADYLGYENISTHSFRKYFATGLYRENGFDIRLVQAVLQHSSPAITQRYIGVSEKNIEDALNNHLNII